MLKFFNFSKFFITNYYTFWRIQLKILGFQREPFELFVMKFGYL